jgi:3,4-dihydroxy 2-butanone 4-phosphate synthase/GTP cyclohydrolase II
LSTRENKAKFTKLDEAIEAFGRGEMVVVADDERRENEGDIIIAAEKITPQAVNFMVTHARGLVCVAMSRTRLQQLGISRMLPFGYEDPYRTAFMQSVDARTGIATGISAKDRARTIQLLADDATKPEELVRPGHIFPLEAVDGGVLKRPGHTEAAVDLAVLAGLKPAGAICEVMLDDGSMARLPELFEFATKHKLPIITVAMIAMHRKRTEKLIEFEEEITLPTDLGEFRVRMYRSLSDGKHHLALIRGQPWLTEDPLVRVHSECLTGDAFGSLRCDCGSQLRKALELIAAENNGVLLYLRQEGRGIGLDQKIRAYALQESGLDTVEANEQLGFEADMRDYSVAAQILNDLNVRRVRLVTNNPKKISGLEDYGIAIAARIPLVLPGGEHSERYLQTKKTKMGHML